MGKGNRSKPSKPEWTFQTRPERQGVDADQHYDAKESQRYNSCAQTVQVQRELTHNAIDLAGCQPLDLIADLGSGSGLSSATLLARGMTSLNLDLSESMLTVARTEHAPACRGLSLRGDLSEGLPFRPGTFDHAVSISAVQWLCRSAADGDAAAAPPDVADATAAAKIDAFFQALKRVVRPGGRSVLQVYLEHEAHGQWLLRGAEQAGFSGTLIADVPHPNPAKKFFICLRDAAPAAPPTCTAAAAPRVLCPIAWPLHCGCALSWRRELVKDPSALASCNLFKEHVRQAKRAVRVVRRAIALRAPSAGALELEEAPGVAPTTYKYESTWTSPMAAEFRPHACAGPTLLTVAGIPEDQLMPTDPKKLASAIPAFESILTHALTGEAAAASSPAHAGPFLSASLQKEQPHGQSKQGAQPLHQESQQQLSAATAAAAGVEPDAKRARMNPAEAREEVAELTLLAEVGAWSAAEARQVGVPPLVALWRDFDFAPRSQGSGGASRVLDLEQVAGAVRALIASAGVEGGPELCLGRPVFVDIAQRGGGRVRAVVAGYRGPDSRSRWAAVDNRLPRDAARHMHGAP